jgi:hypothetical protein
VADAIEAGVAQFAEHGVGVQTCFFGLDGSDGIETVITGALRARAWEWVVVGGGVRTAEDQIELFALWRARPRRNPAMARRKRPVQLQVPRANGPRAMHDPILRR